MSSDRLAKAHAAFSLLVTSLAVIGCSVVAGSAFAGLAGPSIRNRYFPWISGRALGIGAYLSLTALVVLGTWMRHPWRLRQPLIHAEARVRAHAVLAITTVMLVLGHMVCLAADKYAGVGWWGALVPGLSHYRTLPVALGVVAFLGLVLLTLSAGFAGRRGTGHWLLIHRGAALTFAAVWLHGVLAGTDAWRLRLLYLVTGLFTVLVGLTRMTAAAPRVRVERFSAGGAHLEMLLAEPPRIPADPTDERPWRAGAQG